MAQDNNKVAKDAIYILNCAAPQENIFENSELYRRNYKGKIDLIAVIVFRDLINLMVQICLCKAGLWMKLAIAQISNCMRIARPLSIRLDTMACT